MKTPFIRYPLGLLAAFALLGQSQTASAQTPASGTGTSSGSTATPGTTPNGTTTTIPGQPAYIGTEAAWWLANPQALFLQLDVDRDGLLNYNEFNRISVLNTQVVVPGGIGTVAPPPDAPVTQPASGIAPAPGVAPLTGPNGPYTPPTGTPPVGRSGNPYAPSSPPPPTRPLPQ